MENNEKIKLSANLRLKFSLMNIIGLVLIIFFGIPGIISFFIYGVGSLVFVGPYVFLVFTIGIFLLYNSNRLEKKKIEELSKLLK